MLLRPNSSKVQASVWTAPQSIGLPRKEHFCSKKPRPLLDCLRAQFLLLSPITKAKYIFSSHGMNIVCTTVVLDSLFHYILNFFPTKQFATNSLRWQHTLHTCKFIVISLLSCTSNDAAHPLHHDPNVLSDFHQDGNMASKALGRRSTSLTPMSRHERCILRVPEANCTIKTERNNSSAVNFRCVMKNSQKERRSNGWYAGWTLWLSWRDFKVCINLLTRRFTSMLKYSQL